MGKDKLRRFAENETFPNMFQAQYIDLERENGFSLKGEWRRDFFKNNNPIVLELGCGKGEYTVGLGRKYKDKNFIGVDIKGARMWRGCKTSIEENLNNIAFLRTHVQIIDKYFSEGEVDEIWITFCDPQLKKPNKRLTSPRFLDIYSRILKPGGIIHLKTDSQELYDYTLEEVLIPNNYKIHYNTNDLYSTDDMHEVKEIKTYYENIYLKENKPITYLEFEINR
ncbi:MAG: tRNA (guanosine(46)-N7)-methyltransferase TrmB [Bacteroidales bacterium]|jgi:tRNA (guanine-N7-)-methyltransferase|nr:tRNA (guanosine(46)-N7)-methyltransferase TrmB [Bacteroidales bacterium]MDD4544555.1 tRNA (guanosine(46)-N7)-methyltransferase TrmB [Bacteroidales bacterium]MDY0053981.1 tRNA (guanosine(46)-N7)-methyltransferase TrmB [Bacteroidales bacterium]